jgi:hypothetical protein
MIAQKIRLGRYQHRDTVENPKDMYLFFPKQGIVVGLALSSAQVIAWHVPISTEFEYEMVEEVEVSRLILPAAKVFIEAQKKMTRVFYRLLKNRRIL